MRDVYPPTIAYQVGDRIKQLEDCTLWEVWRARIRQLRWNVRNVKLVTYECISAEPKIDLRPGAINRANEWKQTDVQ